MGGSGCPRHAVTGCLSQSTPESRAGLHPRRQRQDQPPQAGTRQGTPREAQKCISNVAASQEKSIIPEGSCLSARLAWQGYAGSSWPPNPPPTIPHPPPCVQDAARAVSPPHHSPSTRGSAGSLHSPVFLHTSCATAGNISSRVLP